MRLSRFHLSTSKETPADAEIISHQLMLKAGMIRKLASGLYTWSPLGLRVLRKVDAIVREEMDRAGALEVTMPIVQPRELWDETGRWQKFGAQLLRIKDRKEADYCFAPTAEEVITDFARQELRSYKQLPVNFYQINTKFRDEIRPRFGVMRAREFIMKDAYSFHLTPECLEREYRNMHAAYTRIFERLGLRFRAVQADSGAIGGDASQEFHVLADSGEDAIAFSDASSYAANLEAAEAIAPGAPRAAPAEEFRAVETPTQRTCEDVAALMGIGLDRTVKSVAFVARRGEAWEFVLALVRGDHSINEIKLAKALDVEELAPADEDTLKKKGLVPGFMGPVFNEGDASEESLERLGVTIVADRTVFAMADFVTGANKAGYHYAGVNWERNLDAPNLVADIRNIVAGDPSPDGQGTLGIARGIEVGHVFQLGKKYAEAMGATVLDDNGKATVMEMGCYGIGVSRIVAAAIEQNFDANGIIWPEAMAPWRVAVCIINPKNDANVRAAAEALYDKLVAAGVEACLDDRGLRPGQMFADIELIGIPHRVVVSERGLAAGTLEYRARRDSEAQNLAEGDVLAKLGVG
jgi:prolyl-tRNA synthetase